MVERTRFAGSIEATLRRRVTGGFIAAVLLTLFLSFWSWHGARRAEQDAYWISHTYEVMATIQGMSRDVLEAETSARAFALSGQDPLLVHYQAARGNVYQDEDALRHLTADNLSQQRRLDALELQVRTALEFAESIIAKRRKLGAYPGGSDALEIERLVVAVRAMTHDMRAEETRLLSQRSQRGAAGQRSTRIIAIAGLFLEAGLWSLAFLIVIREIGVSACARSQLNSLNVELEQRVEERTSALQSEIIERRRTQETAERLAAVVQSSDDAIISKTLDGTITAWNRGAEKIFGYSAEEAVGKSMTLLLPAERSAEESGILERITRGESVRHFDTVRVRKDGKKVDVSVTISPVVDSTGAIVGASKIARDITERKLKEEQRKRNEVQLAGQAQELAHRAEELANSRRALETQTLMLQSVLDSMGEGLIAADLDGRFLIWNDAAKKLMGRDASDLPTEQWTPHYQVFLSDGITPCPADHLPLVRALRGESVQMEMVVQHPGSAGGVFLEVTARPLKDNHGNLGGGVAVLRDITERKAAERQIQTLNQGLESRVIERTAELKAANRELEAFTYSVSHDLRAPLRHISGFTRILVEKFRSSLPAEAQQHLQLIEQGASRMGQLVDELLRLARLGRQALEVKVTRLNSLVEDVVTLLAPETEGRRVDWKIGELPSMECDPILVRQVFQNLIGNALKYSRPRCPAVIEIGQTEREGKRVIFVKDNGVGFDMKYADKLFGVFQRLHVAEEFEGTGIGLATVERIIKKHGGRVWVEAELDRGATFYFTLGGGASPASQRAAAVAGGAR
jgi:PAS domain S-box-containing protein